MNIDPQQFQNSLDSIEKAVKSDESSELCRCELLNDEVILALVHIAREAEDCRDESFGTFALHRAVEKLADALKPTVEEN